MQIPPVTPSYFDQRSLPEEKAVKQNNQKSMQNSHGKEMYEKDKKDDVNFKFLCKNYLHLNLKKRQYNVVWNLIVK